MHAELPFLSFTCAILLAVVLPWKSLRTKVANFTIILWLIVCNIIHGVNGIIWSGNVNVHIPVWCDIAINILRGATVALLTACLCISYNLESISSTRAISGGPHKSKRRAAMELAFCLSLPIIYICIHIIVQDHRFDLVQDFGCSASADPSMPSFIIIWLPPIILCSLSVVYSGLATYNVCKRGSQSKLSSHLESRTPLTASAFSYRLATAFITSISLSVPTLASVISSKLQPRTSSATRVQFADVTVIQSPNGLHTILLTWWIIPLLSFALVVLSIVTGEEDKGIRVWFQTRVRGHNSISLPSHKKKNPDTVSTGNLLAGPKTQTINLKSGWDEMLSDTRKAKGFLPRIKTKSASSYTLSISPEPWSPSSHKTTFRDDDTFMSSTLSYLGSPVAQTLGLNSPSACAPCALSSPVQTQPPKEPPRTYAPADIPRIIKPIPDDAKSTISSLWDKPWPQPPATIPIPSPSSPTFQSRSQMATTPGSASQVVYPAVVPPNLRTSPFEGACISPGPHSPVVPKAALSRRPSMKDLRENGDVAGYAPHEVIYMTPIRETV